MSFLDGVKGLAEGQGAGGGNPALELTSGLITKSGGLGGLVATLHQGGLGAVVDSWVGNGANQSVSGTQLGQALQGTAAGQHVEEMAQKLGVDPSRMLAQLAQHLPDVVNHLTPDGEVPAGGGSGFNLGELSGLANKLGLSVP
ncbi:MAG TPA: YidB family protein [Rhodanobacteraceae bacterium]|nr:YidB family protein [Rhodanobacteraceae bacterium]